MDEVLYGNKSKYANLGMVPVLKKCVNQLNVIQENPVSILDMREDMFGQALHPADDESCRSAHGLRKSVLVLFRTGPHVLYHGILTMLIQCYT